LNPPTLWITINPSDLHDPIAQLFAGEEINLDHFLQMKAQGPSADRRANNIASDPYAAVKFFHFLICTILKTLFGICTIDYAVYNQIGIFGRVSGYFGTMESQGRRTLHLHLLVWLINIPTGEEMKELLKSREFQKKVRRFIQENLCAYMPGLESAESVKAIPVEKEIVFNWSSNLNTPFYKKVLNGFELKLA